MKIADFGAFVNILPGKDGLVHISQIASERVEKVTDYLSEGQIVKVIVLDVERGRIKLSMKEVPTDDDAPAAAETVEAVVASEPEAVVEPVDEVQVETPEVESAVVEVESAPAESVMDAPEGETEADDAPETQSKPTQD